MRSSRRLRWWVRGAVLVPALAVAWLSAADVAGPAGPATLPGELAGYSYLTGSVSASAPGRAMALYQHGFGVEFMDYPQAVVVGADGVTTRRLDVAESRAGGVFQGDPAPMLLSPDGTRIAVGVHDHAEPSLLVVAMADGSVAEHPVPVGRSALPLAWSRDGSRIAYLGGDEATNPHAGYLAVGDVGVLDLADGRAAALPGAEAATAAAFSPDGSELAVQPAAGPLRIVDAQRGGVLRSLRVPSDHALDAPDAWSPDGRLLALSPVYEPCRFEDEPLTCEGVGRDTSGEVAFVDATGTGGPAVPPLDLGGHPVLGWTAADRVVLLVPEPDPEFQPAPGPDVEYVDPDRHWITEVPLDGGEPERLASVPTGGGNYGVSRFQLAGGLLEDVEVAALGPADGGPWPLWLRLLTVVALVGVAGRVLGPVLERRVARSDATRNAVPPLPGPAGGPDHAVGSVGAAAGTGARTQERQHRCESCPRGRTTGAARFAAR